MLHFGGSVGLGKIKVEIMRGACWDCMIEVLDICRVTMERLRKTPPTKRGCTTKGSERKRGKRQP